MKHSQVSFYVLSATFILGAYNTAILGSDGNYELDELMEQKETVKAKRSSEQIQEDLPEVDLDEHEIL